ncbi:MAG: HNH endonuclease signature motif containing protein [Methylocella sp.]
MTRLTQATVRQLLDYNPEAGVLIWRYRDRVWFKSDRSFHSWNARHAGRIAFTARDSSGHLHGKIFGRPHRAHRVIYFWMTGRWPPVVDHENHDRGDNRWTNLRPATALANARNRSLNSNNTSGFCGVHFQNDAGYVAAIQGEYLGSFENLEEAVAVRKAAQCERGFAKGHGQPRC